MEHPGAAGQSTAELKQAPAAGTVSRVPVQRDALLERYTSVRDFTGRLVEPLEIEDMVVQSMPDSSPVKWHLAHTGWFFERLVLAEASSDHAFDRRFNELFNSYYNTLGDPFPRAQRGLLSRPTVRQVLDFRQSVDSRMSALIEDGDPEELATLAAVIEVGLHHEQQHQELLLTDVKHMLSCNPLMPAYLPGHRQGPIGKNGSGGQSLGREWRGYGEGVHWVGHPGGDFGYDNEFPRHRVFLHAFEIATLPVTAGEYLEFIADDGYKRAELWLAEGWNAVQAGGWQAPLYWWQEDGRWRHFTLHGPEDVRPTEPLVHVSHFEADAFARWSGARLPTEFEWEVAAADNAGRGNFADDFGLHPVPADPVAGQLQDMFGNMWEWTASSYSPYPGYRPPAGALGEYNGKFMSNQYVLRGGSFATAESHIRATYRNFFPSTARWQFSGLRLARDAG